MFCAAGVQRLMQQYYGEEGALPAPPPGKWGLTAEGRARQRGPFQVPVTDPNMDLNDELCRVCSQGVRCRTALSLDPEAAAGTAPARSAAGHRRALIVACEGSLHV